MASEASTLDSQAEDLNFSDIPNGLAALKVVPFAGRAVNPTLMMTVRMITVVAVRMQKHRCFGITAVEQ